MSFRKTIALVVMGFSAFGAVAQKANVVNAQGGKPATPRTTVADQPAQPRTSVAATSVATEPTGKPAPRPKSYFDGHAGLLVPEWMPDLMVNPQGDMSKLVAAPWFKDATLDGEVANLPYYDLMVPVGRAEAVVIGQVQAEGVTEITAPVFQETITEAVRNSAGDWYPAQQLVPGDVIRIQGNDFQHVRIYPIQVSTRGDRYRKADRISYSLQVQTDPVRKALPDPARRDYVSESVLREGTFFKIGVTSEGLYQLDYAFFNSLGVDLNTIDPRSVRVYGNGGPALPQVAGTYPLDDLTENALLAQGESDGLLNSGDYFVFYSPGVGRWEDNARIDRYVYFPNFYSDTTFYFVTWGNGNGRRVQVDNSNPSPNFVPTYTTRYGHHEEEKYNAIISGRLWMGERFDLTTVQNFNFNLPNVLPNSQIKTSVRVGAHSNNAPSNFVIREGGVTYATLAPNMTVPEYATAAYYGANRTFDIPASRANDGQLNLELTYSKPTTSSVGYLDYITYEYQATLDLNGFSYFPFTATDNIGPGQVFQYNFTGASGSTQIWDVTDPVNVRALATTINGSNLSFTVNADSNKRFIAFTGIGYKRPVSVRSIPNQNLHALPQADFVIITHALFESDAERLARMHREDYNQIVHVVRIDDIYNEFSSGAQDPTAIRDFLKMFYDRGLAGATPTLKYALLVGDGSYDYKHIQTAQGTNFIPPYESRRSQAPTGSYTSDDYFGFLDDGEGHWGEQAHSRDSETIPLFLAEGDTNQTDHGLDIGVGRLPVASQSEAAGLIDKIIGYHRDAASYGPWRNRLLLVADHLDRDGFIHADQADGYSPQIEAAAPCVNIDKIYMDNYVMENQASGDHFPDGKAALLRALDEGSLIVNYTGHGGEVGWSNASILDVSDINRIANDRRLPAYMTATCEFGRWDDPTRKAAAEIMLLRPDGGSVAMLTTVRVVFSGPNHTLNTNYYNEVFDYNTLEDRWYTIGETFMRTKNLSWGSSTNNRAFSLLGDPAMQLAYPEHHAVVTKINGVSVQSGIVDTLRPLNLITIEGEARDGQGNVMTGYNGELSVTVFDKASKFRTRRRPITFIWRKNRVFKGTSTVQNGLFSFQFVVPVDISYEDQLADLNGKISLYFTDMVSDGGGCDDKIFVGGSGTTTIVDDRAPELDLFMNDIKFADGGLVSPDPVLLADIFDENGINTVGTGIGHELTAILDGDESNVFVLNDFYEASRNSYQQGTIKYPFQDLSTGEHNLRVKVWDVANNSKEGEINFVVADDASMALGHVVNYPNPFTTNTKFFIEHNRNGSSLAIQVKIYTVSGKLVKTLEDNLFADGNLYCDLEWDGTDDYGDLIGRGAYVYQVTVKDETTGESVSTFEKLVVLR